MFNFSTLINIIKSVVKKPGANQPEPQVQPEPKKKTTRKAK